MAVYLEAGERIESPSVSFPVTVRECPLSRKWILLSLNVTRLSIADHVGAPDTPIDFEGFERLPNEVFYNKLIHASTASIEKA